MDFERLTIHTKVIGQKAKRDLTYVLLARFKFRSQFAEKDHRNLVPAWFQTTEIGRKSLVC